MYVTLGTIATALRQGLQDKREVVGHGGSFGITRRLGTVAGLSLVCAYSNGAVAGGSNADLVTSVARVCDGAVAGRSSADVITPVVSSAARLWRRVPYVCAGRKTMP